MEPRFSLFRNYLNWTASFYKLLSFRAVGTINNTLQVPIPPNISSKILMCIFSRTKKADMEIITHMQAMEISFPDQLMP